MKENAIRCTFLILRLITQNNPHHLHAKGCFEGVHYINYLTHVCICLLNINLFIQSHAFYGYFNTVTVSLIISFSTYTILQHSILFLQNNSRISYNTIRMSFHSIQSYRFSIGISYHVIPKHSIQHYLNSVLSVFFKRINVRIEEQWQKIGFLSFWNFSMYEDIFFKSYNIPYHSITYHLILHFIFSKHSVQISYHSIDFLKHIIKVAKHTVA